MIEKVFASDFDGTLYFGAEDVQISPESIEMIRKYQEAGNLFGLCTGRPIDGITPFIAGQIIPDFYTHTSHTQTATGTVFFKVFSAKNSHADCAKLLAADKILCK